MAEEEKKKKKRRRTTEESNCLNDDRVKKYKTTLHSNARRGRKDDEERKCIGRRKIARQNVNNSRGCGKHACQIARKFRITSSASTSYLYLLCLMPFVLQCSSYVAAEGNVGCLYVGSLCLDGMEFCYDDAVFGKCLSKAGVEMEDIDRAPLTEEQSRILATMLEELQGAGLGWDHPFVQCRIQGALFAMRRRTQLPPNLCANLVPDPEILGPQSALAFVRFTPPDTNDEYADEVYYPPPKKEFDSQNFMRPMTPAQKHRAENMELIAELAHQPDILEEERQRIIQESLAKQEIANRVKDMRNRLELQKMLSEYERGELKPPIFANNDIYLDPSELFEGQEDEDFDERIDNYKRSEPEMQNTVFREIARNQHISLNREPQPQPMEYFSHYKKAKPFVTDIYNDEIKLANSLHRPKEQHHRPDQIGVYTEGGFFIPSEHENNDGNNNKEARTLLANMLAFTRRERLDVKKPGPLTGPPPNEKNNKTSSEAVEKQQSTTTTKSEKTETKEVLPAHIKTDSIKKAKKVLREHSSEDHAPYSVDTEYAFVIMKHPIDSWADGVRIVNALANTLQMNFTHPRVDSHEVSFRVEPNPEKKSAAEVAKSINADRFRSNIYRRFGVTVVRAGVGNKIKDDPEDEAVQASKMVLSEEGPDVTHIMAYMFAGAGAAAAIVIVVVLFLIRRHDKKRDKLGGIQGSTTGNESCSKDYQELCRARMAAKGQSQDSPGGGRISALTKENERPPSSRSSTSSWSEEPALTNMDISTGHMVLSYMEDHLRNKGRLQREWEALCRYEAEPSARDAALQEECTALNRPLAPLPYDHSRVVLNHLANAEGLDYINASTITDHDPRAPAYVAAQGPLPTTLAHFWQMVWEQGAVVIVALCRLQENGEQACARYWPEEGAEVYHIYEVHLVSEHIWCDDYLVRSFYLKNLRTSETRTVTQFHFLSWPQSGVPPQAKALLEFRRKVNKSYRGRSCPIVVHGSNGAGRTGAYILLDLVLGRMNKGAREIDIAATLEHLRDQRAGLVATRQQFEFVLMAVAEEVHAILKALPANQSEKRDLDKDAVKEEDEEEVRLLQKKQEKSPKAEKKDDSAKESKPTAAPAPPPASSGSSVSKPTATTSKKDEK